MRFTSGCIISSGGCFGQFGKTCDACSFRTPRSPEEQKRLDKLTKDIGKKIGEAWARRIDKAMLALIDNRE